MNKTRKQQKSNDGSVNFMAPCEKGECYFRSRAFHKIMKKQRIGALAMNMIRGFWSSPSIWACVTTGGSVFPITMGKLTSGFS